MRQVRSRYRQSLSLLKNDKTKTYGWRDVLFNFEHMQKFDTDSRCTLRPHYVHSVVPPPPPVLIKYEGRFVLKLGWT